MYLNDIKDLFGDEASFVFVKEPEYSQQVLLEFQKKYDIETNDFFTFYRTFGVTPVKIDAKELARWEHHYEIFKMAGGDIWNLKEPNRQSESLKWRGNLLFFMSSPMLPSSVFHFELSRFASGSIFIP
ncbi:MAG TPA: hypothetical protein GXX39_05545 [Syntrophothermus lipocalidus]|nr:hypothetical protein [Syntrophothermus lipocalidus]